MLSLDHSRTSALQQMWHQYLSCNLWQDVLCRTKCRLDLYCDKVCTSNQTYSSDNWDLQDTAQTPARLEILFSAHPCLKHTFFFYIIIIVRQQGVMVTTKGAVLPPSPGENPVFLIHLADFSYIAGMAEIPRPDNREATPGVRSVGKQLGASQLHRARSCIGATMWRHRRSDDVKRHSLY